MNWLRFVPCFLCLLAGCSGDPTAKQFEKFAREYADSLNAKWLAEADGGEPTKRIELVGNDLRKTDSLTAPFVGTAVFDIENSGLTLRDSGVPNEETRATYFSTVALTFGWVDGGWQHNGGTAQITRVALPDLTTEQAAGLPDYFGKEGSTVSADAAREGQIVLTNGFVNLTKEEYEAMRQASK